MTENDGPPIQANGNGKRCRTEPQEIACDKTSWSSTTPGLRPTATTTHTKQQPHSRRKAAYGAGNLALKQDRVSIRADNERLELIRNRFDNECCDLDSAEDAELVDNWVEDGARELEAVADVAWDWELMADGSQTGDGSRTRNPQRPGPGWTAEQGPGWTAEQGLGWTAEQGLGWTAEREPVGVWLIGGNGTTCTKGQTKRPTVTNLTEVKLTRPRLEPQMGWELGPPLEEYSAAAEE